MDKLKEWLGHAKDSGALHVSIPIPIVEKIIKHIEAGAKETGEQLGNAIGEAMFDR